MARRVVTNDNPGVPSKDLKRDSKGFEDFDDYFESSGNDSTINTVGEKTNDESMEDDSVTEVQFLTPNNYLRVSAMTLKCKTCFCQYTLLSKQSHTKYWYSHFMRKKAKKSNYKTCDSI